MRVKLVTLVLLLTATPNAFSQAFGEKGYSARANALGRSVVSLTNDPVLIFYNPAANGGSDRPSVLTSYTSLFPGIADANFNFITLSGIYPLSNLGVVGLGVTQFSPTGWAENVIVGNLSSKMLTDNLLVGGSVKYLHWKSDAPKGENAVPEPGFAYNGISFDLGASFILREVLKENDIRFGFSLLDINQPSVAVNGSADARLPLRISAGVSYISHTYNYVITTQVSKVDNEVLFSGGAELLGLQSKVLGIDGKFLVRLGGSTGVANFNFVRLAKTGGGGKRIEFFNGDQLQGDYNAGFGVQAGALVIDYAYVMQAVAANVGGINTVSVGYTF